MTFFDEIEQQPGMLRNFMNTIDCDGVSSKIKELIVRKKINSFIFTGMGSSLFAGYLAVRYLRRKGIYAIAVEASELMLLNTEIYDDKTLVVAISQSGESIEVVELVDILPFKENLVVVTNYTGSRLQKKSNCVFTISAGIEYFTSTKTYTNTIAATIYLSCLLGGADTAELNEVKRNFLVSAKEMEKLIADKDLAKDLSLFIKDINFMLCVGSGYSYTSACHSEIVLEEAGKIYSSRYTPGQFIHGPIELIGEGFGVIIFDFDSQAHEKCKEVIKNVLNFGGRVLHITNNKEIKPGASTNNLYVCYIPHDDPLTSLLVEIIPVEIAINSLALAQGLEPGKLSRVIKRIVENK